MENQINVSDQNTQQVGQNPVNQSAQIPEKPKINYLITGLVVLVCFIILGFGGYYLGRQSGQTQNTTAINNAVLPTLNVTNSPTPQTKLEDTKVDWKTYTNQKFEFSFKYPPSLKIIDNSNYAKPGKLSVGFLDHPFNILTEELAKVNTKNYLNMPKVSQKTVNEITWDILYFESKSPESGGPQTVYQTTNKDYRYVVQYNQQTLVDIDQILSTFMFLD